MRLFFGNYLQISEIVLKKDHCVLYNDIKDNINEGKEDVKEKRKRL